MFNKYNFTGRVAQVVTSLSGTGEVKSCAKELCKISSKIIHDVQLWLPHTYCLHYEQNLENSIKAFQECEHKLVKTIQPKKAGTIKAQHRLYRLIGYCNYPMKMTMQKSYFQCLALALKRIATLEKNVEKIFNTGSDTSNLEDLIVLDIFDIIECVQQELWLVVTSMPTNTFGKKASSIRYLTVL